jgi:DNA-binding transcriptional LysR family regulator
MMMQRLEYAVALEEYRNFSRAAEHLGVSQPTLTRGIQELEREFGVQLFDRTRLGIYPTAFGKIVIEGARKISSCYEDLQKQIAACQGLERAQLKVGIGPIVAQTWFPDALVTLLGLHPAAEVHVSTCEWWEFVPRLLDHSIELAIGEIVPDVSRHSEVTVLPLPARPIRFFCRSGHPLTQIEKPTMAEIGEYPMASTKLPLRASEHFAGTRALGKLSEGGMYFEPQISCQTFEFCLRIIKSSNNIGIAPLAQLAKIAGNSEFSVIPFDAPSLRTNYGIMRLRDRSLSPSATAFLDHAIACERNYHSASTADGHTQNKLRKTSAPRDRRAMPTPGGLEAEPGLKYKPASSGK